MRVFAALPLPPSLCDYVRESGELIKQRYHGIRLVKHDAMHITLYFFGEITQDQADVLLKLMQDTSLKQPQFSISLAALDQFPPRGRPRVLFYNIAKGKDEVCTVYSCFRELIAKNGWPVQPNERPFTPHITVARNKFERIDISSLTGIPAAEGRFNIDRLVLYQSILKPAGAEYVELKEVAFGATS